MSELKKRIKLHLFGSLVQRVLLIGFFFFVVPLLIHTFVLYYQEDESKVEDAKLVLQIVAEAEKALIQEKIRLEWKILDEYFIAQKNSLFGIKKVGMPPGVESYFAIVKEDEDAFWVGRQISDEEAIVLPTKLNTMFHEITDFEQGDYPVSVAFVDAEGKTIAGARQESILAFSLPIQGASFNLYVSFPPMATKELKSSRYIQEFGVLLFWIIGLGVPLLWGLIWLIAKPLKSLSKVMEQVGLGKVHERYTPDWMGFEINDLGKQFNQTVDLVLYHQDEASKERLGRERLAEELRIGHEIQEDLLPKHLPKVPQLQVGIGFLPAREVGGDFYDFFILPNQSVLMIVADAAGKGVSACLYSLGLRSSLRAIASMTQDLSEIILRVNDLFFEDVHTSGMFISAWVAIFDPKTQQIQYCSQGHPAALLVREDTIEKLWTPGTVLGAQKFESIAVHTKTMLSKDRLILYTDGVIEAENAHELFFGMEQFQASLMHHRHLSAKDLASTIIHEVRAFSGAHPQSDDITVLVLSF
jgi:serine phosphatase RsbU (regulator of sigma subunit)